MIRDSDATRARLLAAARREFAQFGFAGARVDRIATEAGSNKAQIYHYFGSKDGLFDAVYEAIVDQSVTGLALDVSDLPGYAERLARSYVRDPDSMRLNVWHNLERESSPLIDAIVQANEAKIAKLARAQVEGIVPSRFPAPVLLALVVQTASLWATMPEELSAVVGTENDEDRYRYVREAVEAILSV